MTGQPTAAREGPAKAEVLLFLWDLHPEHSRPLVKSHAPTLHAAVPTASHQAAAAELAFRSI